MQQQEVSIIGTGALGGVLARALVEENFPIISLFNRSGQSLSVLNEQIDVPLTRAFPNQLTEVGSLIFLTVPDEKITDIANQLALLSDDFLGRMVVHCSGTKTSGSLSVLQQKGALIASFHPLQTFTQASVPNDLHNIFFDIEGDQEAVDYLMSLAHLWNSKCIEINPEAKPYLHAAAVMSSNYLIALIELSSTIAEMGGIEKEEACKALMPLMQQSLQNVLETDTLSNALSGPIARGDLSTVQEHLRLLEQNPGALALYKQLGTVALELARSGDQISDQRLDELSKILNA